MVSAALALPNDVRIALGIANWEKRAGLVEAAGVEPASENVTGKETTCLVAFMLPYFYGNFRSRRSERTRNANC